MTTSACTRVAGDTYRVDDRGGRRRPVRDDADALDAEQHRAAGVVGQERRGGFQQAELQRVGRVGPGRAGLVDDPEHEARQAHDRAFERLQRDVAGEAVGDDDIGAAPRDVAALDVADETLHVGEQLRRLLAERVALARLLTVRQQRDRSALSTPRRTRAYACASSAHSTSHSGSGSTVAPPSTSSWMRSSPNTGSGNAIAGRCTPLIRPNRKQRGSHRRAGVARADHRRGAAVADGLRAPRTIEESFLVRTAAAGSSSIAMTSAASRISTPAGSRPSGRCATDRIRPGPTSNTSTSHSVDGPQRARDDLRRRAVAAHRVDRDHGRHGSYFATRRRGPGGLGTNRSCRTPGEGAATRRSSGTASAPGAQAACSPTCASGSRSGSSCASGRPWFRSSSSKFVIGESRAVRVTSSSERSAVPPGVGSRWCRSRSAARLWSMPQFGHRPWQSGRHSGTAGSSSRSASRISGSRSMTSSSAEQVGLALERLALVQLADRHRELAADGHQAAAAGRVPGGCDRAPHDDALGDPLQGEVDGDRPVGRNLGARDPGRRRARPRPGPTGTRRAAAAGWRRGCGTRWWSAWQMCSGTDR